PGSGSVSTVNGLDPDGAGNVALGISDIPNLSTLLDDKVDKVTGKGLSTEDFTTPEKTKLANINLGFPAVKPSLRLDFVNQKKLDPRINFTRASDATYW